VVLFFAATNSLFKALINSSAGFKDLIGMRAFMPDIMGYKWAVIALIVLFLVYALVGQWNEETDKFTVEM